MHEHELLTHIHSHKRIRSHTLSQQKKHTHTNTFRMVELLWSFLFPSVLFSFRNFVLCRVYGGLLFGIT